MTIGIYKIENIQNGKVYIGQSIHIEKRWQEHCKSSSHSLIGKTIQKYGKENFSFQILEECLVEELDEKESYYINYFDSIVPKGYNIVLNSLTNNQIFANYDKDIFEQIVFDIKDNKLSFKEIAHKYDLDLSMIYYLNRGDYHTIENETYPLREVNNNEKKYYYCIDCGVEIGKNALRCSKCDHIKQRVCERPSREEFKNLIRTKSFVELAKQYNVSDKAITKWCKAYNLPSRKKDIKILTDEEWSKI